MFKIYSSSAGSGKTYTLTKEYLKLALGAESDDYFRHILAVTFTNAAAAEMKDRIMSSLQVFTSDAAGESAMFQDIVSEVWPSEVSDPVRKAERKKYLMSKSRRVLTRILHRYSDFSVMTIDKFTKRLVGSFTDELGLPFGFETTLESELVDLAVDKLLARIGKSGEEVLTEVLQEYYLEKAGEGKSWKSLPGEIKRTARELLNETSQSHLQKVADLSVKDWFTIRRQLTAFTLGHRQKIQDWASEAFMRIEQEGLTDKDFYQGSRGVYGYFKSRSENEKLFDAPNSYVRASVDDEKWYAGKTSASAKNSIDAIRDDLTDTIQKMENIRESTSGRVALYQALEKHLYKLSLLGEIRKEFEKLLRARNQAHISEFNRKILNIVSREPVPFIFEKLGEKFNHILIDEFQDTSKLQFANILPLIDNALAYGHFNLIVGDPKQAIYRFRGGDMDLILKLSNLHTVQLAKLLGDDEFTTERLLTLDQYQDLARLKTNRRSFREITEFNNRLFSFLSDSLAPEFPEIAEVFDTHFQQEIPDSVRDGGTVEVAFVDMKEAGEPDEDTDERISIDPMVSEVISRVDALRSQGYEWKDIAILSRRNADSAFLANTFQKLGWPLISDDSLLLAFSEPVRLVASFMQVFNTPENTTARYKAASAYHLAVQRITPDSTQLSAMATMAAEYSLDSFLNYFREYGVDIEVVALRRAGLYEFCEKICQVFTLFATGSNSYLFRFLDIVWSFAAANRGDMSDFLNYWQTAQHKISITVPETANAIRITSIHKSKGLEFPVVIIPYAHWRFTPMYAPIWVDLQGIDEPELAVAGLEKRLTTAQADMQSALSETPLAGQYQEEKQRVLIENLNLLYVALTRPVQRLYLLAKKEDNWNKTPTGVHFWLHNYLEQANEGTDAEQTVFSAGTGNALPVHHHRPASSVPYMLDSVISSDRRSSVRLRRLAERVFDTESFELRFDLIQKTRYALSFIKTPDDIPPILRRLANEGIAGKNDLEKLGRSLTEILNSDRLSVYFQRDVVLIHSREILIPGGQILVPDRVVIHPDGSCSVVNFVVRRINKEARNEMRQLVASFAAMGYSNTRGVIVSLDNHDLTEVIG